MSPATLTAAILYGMLILSVIGIITCLVFLVWVLGEFSRAAIDAFSSIVSKALGYYSCRRFYEVMIKHRKNIRELSKTEADRLDAFLQTLFAKP